MAITLAPASAAAASDQSLPALGAYIVAAGAVSLGIATGLWAIAQQRVVSRALAMLAKVESRLRSAAQARDALLAAGRESMIVWGRDGSPLHAYGLAELLLDACLSGPEATKLSEAIDGLSDRGASFAFSVIDNLGRRIALRGRAVGAMAAIWLEEEAAARTNNFDFAAILDALPAPVWLRDRTLALTWANRAFLAATGFEDVAGAVVRQPTLEKSERDLAAAARAEALTQVAKRFAVLGGQRRALSFTHTPIADGVVGSAMDITDLSSAEARLQQHIDAHADTLDKLATAVAIFDREQKLAFHNRAFALLWNLPEDWLDSRPAHGEVLDRLREQRRLPEQRDYQAWKRQRLALCQEGGDLPEDLWHLPGGKTLRVVAQPHPFGGLTFLYEDVTEKLALESSYNTLIKVQSATLDTLQEGVAVFGPDARLKLHNAAFARIWELEPNELSGEPHLQKLAETSIARFGEESFWLKLVATVASGAERRRDWGEIERSDKTILALSLAPLPDGATLVTFFDVTDRSRIESALRDRAEALEAADQLKSDFIHHASFLFRDPLNAVHGFAEMLAGGQAGSLNTRQRDYVQNILSASNKLAEVTSDILDLAMIDSGAMRLELARIDLHDLLAHVAEPLRRHAESLDIGFTLDCAPDIGDVVVDPRRVRQAVFNLLSNAFKYTPRGGTITLGAAILGDDTQIFVSDSGPGIAPEVKASVFERFSAKSRAGKGAGAGLGLALVNRFVELHDGWVEIESGNAGTLVRCHLPRRLSDSGTRRQPAAAASALQG
ncbi:MAG TPA: PAS-domain containing protein [Rhizomicrobium sp.]